MTDAIRSIFDATCIAAITAGIGAVALAVTSPAAVLVCATVGMTVVGLLPYEPRCRRRRRRDRMPLVIAGPGQGARRALMPDGRTLHS